MTFAVFSKVGQSVFQRQQVLGVIIPVKKRKAFVSIEVVERKRRRHAIPLAELHDTKVDISNLVHITLTHYGCFYCVTQLLYLRPAVFEGAGAVEDEVVGGAVAVGAEVAHALELVSFNSVGELGRRGRLRTQ